MITDKIKARHLDESLLELINKPSVSSWNDLTDRPFGEIEVEKVYFDFNGDIGADVAANKVYGSFIELSDTLIAGQSYNIIYNGVLYENCVAIDTNGTISVGCNTENGYIKIYDYINHQDWLAIQDTTGDEENITISIKVTGMTKDTVVKRLDGKYLPEGYSYVEEGGMVEILPETTLTEEQLQNDGIFYPSIMPEANKQYIVIWNGVEYITTAIEVTENDTTGIVLGDAYTASNGAMGNSATGEPFCLVCQSIEESIIAMVIALDDSTEVTLSIYQQNEIVHTMDPKFLPLKFIEGSGGVAATDTLTFNRNLEGKEYVQVDEGMYFVHMSDTFIDSSELIGGTITIVSNDEEEIPSGTYPIVDNEDMIIDMSTMTGFPAYTISEFIVILSQPFTREGVTLPKGISFMYVQDMFYISELKAPKAIFSNKENILLLDPEYIKDMYYEKKEEEIFQYSNGFSDENGLGQLGSNLTLSPFSTSFITENNQYTIIVNDIEYSNYKIVSEVDFEGVAQSGKSIMVYATNLIEGQTNLIQISEGIVQGYNVFAIHINNVTAEVLEANPDLRNTKIKIIKNNNTIKQIDPKYLPTSIQSDWAENDENNISYIKNRPFYDEIEYTTFKADTTISGMPSGFDDNVYGGPIPQDWEHLPSELTVGESYAIKIDGKYYICELEDNSDGVAKNYCFNYKVILNDSGTIELPHSDSFTISYGMDGDIILWRSERGLNPVIGIYYISSKAHPIDEKYLPDTVATKEFVTNEVDTLKKSVSDGKSLVAGAITDKGIITAADATFATMAQNINNIKIGVDTSDANVTVDKILVGYSGYANGVKVEGNIPVTSPKGYINGKGYISGTTKTLNVGIDSHQTGKLPTLLDSSKSWSHCCYGNGVFVAVSNAELDFIPGDDEEDLNTYAAYSTDGINWTITIYNQQPEYPTDLIYANGVFVLCSEYGGLFYSLDGKTWNLLQHMNRREWMGATFLNGVFFVYARGSDVLVYSTDGINWISCNNIPENIQGIYYLDYIENIYFASAENNEDKGVILYSTDGVNYSSCNIPENAYIDRIPNIYYHQNKYYMNNHNYNTDADEYLMSEDGITWVTTDSIPQEETVRSTYCDGLYISTSYKNGYISYSTDNINWTETDISVYQYGEYGVPKILNGNGKIVLIALNDSTISITPKVKNFIQLPANTYLDGIEYIELSHSG